VSFPTLKSVVFTLKSVVFTLKQTLLSVEMTLEMTLVEALFLYRSKCRNDTPVFTVCDPCHEKKVIKNLRYYLTTSEESEDTTKQTLDD
jgi:hypothetical protein